MLLENPPSSTSSLAYIFPVAMPSLYSMIFTYTSYSFSSDIFVISTLAVLWPDSSDTVISPVLIFSISSVRTANSVFRFGLTVMLRSLPSSDDADMKMALPSLSLYVTSFTISG